MGYRRLPLDVGFVEYLVEGPEDARDLLIFHVGTPSAAVRYDGLVRAAGARGMRVASYSRCGYGASPRREGRSIADEAAITAALADRLGFERFLTAGWSGGGPSALACAALLGDRVKACLALASLAPRAEAGAAWEAWHTPEQRQEWDDLAGDPTPIIPEFQATVPQFARMTGHRLSAIAGPPDARAIAQDHAGNVEPALVRSMRRAVSRGYFGFLDDNLAQARDWGFRVAEIRVPVVVRHGELDRLVDVRQGRWLAATIQGARGRFLPDAGHGSIALPWSEVVDDLVSAAR
jgi:pimeloyl-ACP methyl ester carboxylesterase